VDDERRQFQRLNFSKPIDGWFGDYAVRLRDISANGALVEHDDEIEEGSRALLRFCFRREEVELLAETVRRSDGSSGLHFLESSETLNKVLAESAVELLMAQEANASGDREHNVIGDETLTSASGAFRVHLGAYVTWTLEGDAWKCRHSMLPDQPPNGFTVSAQEDETQVAMLCRTYADGDEEARRLTRLLAELSVAAPRSSP
jgi:hypothetical protein